ncbi:hypothetical protein A7X67_04225 [Clostridium sp. W14A]|nr:hypothetical protein A7X67_04225 [Clostridium sp. W14A]
MKMQVQMEAQHYHKELMEEIKQRSGSTWEKEVEIKRLEVQTKIRLFIHFVLSQKSTVKVPLGLKSRTAFCLQSEEQADPAPFVSLDCFGKLF